MCLPSGWTATRTWARSANVVQRQHQTNVVQQQHQTLKAGPLLGRMGCSSLMMHHQPSNTVSSMPAFLLQRLRWHFYQMGTPASLWSPRCRHTPHFFIFPHTFFPAHTNSPHLQVAPYGRLYTYQASKWYASKAGAERFPALVKMCGQDVDSYDPVTGVGHTIEPHFDTGNAWLWGLCIIFGRFSGFEQTYPTCRLLLQCGHLSFAYGPYGQLCHAVAQGTSDEPRCCVLLHLHLNLTEDRIASELVGFKG